MTIEYSDDCARLSGDIDVTQADGLLAWVSARARPRIDLAACTHLHAANLQVLLAARVQIAEQPADDDLRAWLQPLFDNSTSLET